MAVPALLILSALLHAAWNAVTKLSRDKDNFIFLSIIGACLLVFSAVALNGQGLNFGPGPGLRIALISGLFEGGYFIALSRSLAKTSLAKAYAIMRGGAMVAVWGVSIGLGLESIHGLTILGSVIILGGIAITGLSRSHSARRTQELLWPLVGAIFIAGYHLLYGEGLKTGAEPESLFALSMAVSVPFIFWVSKKSLLSRSRSTWAEEKLKLGFSVVAATLGFVIFLYGLKSSGPGYAISLRNTSIFFSVGFSILIRDQVTRLQIVGALVVGMGAALLGLGGSL